MITADLLKIRNLICMSTMDLSLTHLPQEILHHVLLYLPPLAVLNFQQVCHAFDEICGPLLWRTICLRRFQYWSPKRQFPHKVSMPVVQVEWKLLYADRYTINQHIGRKLDSILDAQMGRIEKMRSILQYGYDAKDVLLEHLHIEDDAPDVLSRRWYSRAVLTCIHRGTALEQWLELRQASGDYVPLEKALGAFDLFIIQDGKGDLQDITAKLNELADRFRHHHPAYMDMSDRRRAIAVADFVLAQGLVGIQGNVDAHYHDLQNNFIGLALRSGQRSSLPLISVAIYCCIAQRLGLDARPCGFPWHALAIVESADGHSLDGRQLAVGSAQERMYMDPFRSAEEVQAETLIAQLVSMGVPQVDHAKLLDIAPTAEIVARCARSIIRSFQILPRHSMADVDFPSLNAAFYGALWALLLLPGEWEETSMEGHRLQYLPLVMKHVEAQFPNGESIL